MTIKLIPIEAWAAAKYAPPPSAWILARWCRDGEIHPAPERVGRAWFVLETARRSNKRREWPRGLREPRPGYYCWEQPGGKLLIIGRVPFAVARNEALAANSHIAATKPTLLDKLAGAGRTLDDLLSRMTVSPKANTAKSSRSLDKIIKTLSLVCFLPAKPNTCSSFLMLFRD